jgi:hypothetical protein
VANPGTLQVHCEGREMSIAQILKDIPFFSHLSESELEQLAKDGQLDAHPSG